MKKIFIALLLFNLAACAAPKLDVNKYEYGSSKNVKKLVKDFVFLMAKDPDSITIKKITEPEKTFINNTKLSSLMNPFIPVWGVCVTYRGANSYGGFLQTTENYYVKNDEVLYSAILGYKNEMPTYREFKPCGF